MTPADGSAAPLVFPIDTEHGGIRLLVPLLSLGTFIVLFFGLNTITAAEVRDVIGCVAFASGVAGAVVMAFVADKVLKQVWPSPKRLVLDATSLTLSDRRTPDADVRLRLGERLNALAWRFTVKRSSARVQRGWHMLGVQLTQDDTQLTLYTFVSPKDAETFPLYAQFTALLPRSVLDKGDVPLREAAQQRRLLAAEDERWQAGAELERKDFAQVLERLTADIPEWDSRR
jgi:hypothetical protein